MYICVSYFFKEGTKNNLEGVLLDRHIERKGDFFEGLAVVFFFILAVRQQIIYGQSNMRSSS